LKEDIESIIKEVEGPSGAQRKKINLNKTKGELAGQNQNIISSQISITQSIKAKALIRAYRNRGHLIASLDPLGRMERNYIHELHPEEHGFKKEEYDKKIFIGTYLNTTSASVKEILQKLRKGYGSNIGVEYMHISEPIEKIWFRERRENEENQINFTSKGKKAILNKIVQAEGFEKFLEKKYVGTKRIGLDGAESLIPALEQIIKRGGQLGVKEIKIGRPHRGRMKVWAKV
jgi:2-oxoglutarate dehydrogenase complex, dehydrogenase (E1) component, and related enzymes